MGKYRKKPVVIDAVQWTGENLREIIVFTDRIPAHQTYHDRMKWEEYEDLVARDGSTYFEVLNSHEAKFWASHGYIVTEARWNGSMFKTI